MKSLGKDPEPESPEFKYQVDPEQPDDHRQRVPPGFVQRGICRSNRCRLVIVVSDNLFHLGSQQAYGDPADGDAKDEFQRLDVAQQTLKELSNLSQACPEGNHKIRVCHDEDRSEDHQCDRWQNHRNGIRAQNRRAEP